jgi:hypothetical protein
MAVLVFDALHGDSRGLEHLVNPGGEVGARFRDEVVGEERGEVGLGGLALGLRVALVGDDASSSAMASARRAAFFAAFFSRFGELGGELRSRCSSAARSFLLRPSALSFLPMS